MRMKNYFRMKSRVGRGAQHIVGEIGDGRLIKYPHWTGKKWDISTADTVQKDLDIHHKFGTPIPETRVVLEPDIDDGKKIISPPYAILVEKIRGRILREADLADTGIREQFKTLIERSLAIRGQTGSGVDFMGFESIGHLFEYFMGRISAEELGTCNILINSRNQIKLIDTSLLSPARAPTGIGWAIDFLIDVQHSLMAEVLQDRKLLRQCSTDNRSRLMTRLAEEVYALSRPKTGHTVPPPPRTLPFQMPLPPFSNGTTFSRN